MMALPERGYKMKKIMLLAAAVLLFSSGAAYCADADSAIKGTANFLVDRANATIICMFEDMVVSNPGVQKYFPFSCQA